MAFDNVVFTKSASSADCGAACMVSLLKYYGIETTLEDMTKECRVTVNGCNGRNLVETAKAHGLKMYGWKELAADEVPKQDTIVIDVPVAQEDRPSIVWWKYNHFLICCGMTDDGRVLLVNPARGKYTVSKKLFNSYYSGVSFTIGIPELATAEPADK